MKINKILIIPLSIIIFSGSATHCMKKLTPKEKKEKASLDAKIMSLKEELMDLSNKENISEETKKSVIAKFDNLKDHMDPGSKNYTQELINKISNKNQQPQPQPAPVAAKKKATETPKVTALEAKDLIIYQERIKKYIESLSMPSFNLNLVPGYIGLIDLDRAIYDKKLQRNENKIKERSDHFKKYLDEIDKFEKELKKSKAYKDYEKKKAPALPTKPSPRVRPVFQRPQPAPVSDEGDLLPPPMDDLNISPLVNPAPRPGQPRVQPVQPRVQPVQPRVQPGQPKEHSGAMMDELRKRLEERKKREAGENKQLDREEEGEEEEQ